MQSYHGILHISLKKSGGWGGIVEFHDVQERVNTAGLRPILGKSTARLALGWSQGT